MNFDETITRRGLHSVRWDQSGCDSAQEPLVLTVAEMDYPLAEAIVEAGHRRLDAGFLGYGYCFDTLSARICSWMNEYNHAHLMPEALLVTPVASSAICWCIAALSAPGEGVLIQTPAYGPFFDAIENCGRTLLTNALIYDQGSYRIDFADFEKKLSNARIFLLCSPHNPTGHVFSHQDLQHMVDLCRQYHVQIISDEVHADWSYVPFESITAVDAAAITICSGAKTFNLQGLQTSFTFILDEDKRAKVKHEMDRCLYHHVGSLDYELIDAAFTHGRPWLLAAKAYTLENFKQLQEDLADTKVNVCKPEATFMAWLDFTAYFDHPDQVAAALAAQQLFVNSGAFFHEEKAFVRMTVGQSHLQIKQAAQRIKAALASR